MTIHGGALLSMTARDSELVTDVGNTSSFTAAGSSHNASVAAGVYGDYSISSDGTLHCSHGALLGPLGLVVQGLLAFLAFCSLIVKRFCEPSLHRRPWKIWFFDTSKQAIGAAVIHFANVFLAGMFQGDPCTWYIVSFLLDSTVGLVIIYIGLKIAELIGEKLDMKTLHFGEYGSPPHPNYWMAQSGVYILVMIVEKILMTLLVLFHFWKEVRTLIMSPIKDPNVELIIVMFIVPLIVNAFIFWVVDNFLMHKSRRNKQSHPQTSQDLSSIKYTKATNKVRYYDHTAQADESDLDILLSQDEDAERGQYNPSSPTGSLPEQDQLLMT